MKKIIICSLVLLSLFVLSSCQTGHLDYPLGEGREYIPLVGTYENDDISVAVQSGQILADSSYLDVLVKNKTSEILMINANTLLYSNPAQSIRLVTGETRKIYANMTQADIPVAPNGYTAKGLYPSDENSYIFSTIKGSLYLSYTKGSDSKTIGVELKPSTANEESIEVLGTVSVKGKIWRILFIGDARQKACDELLEEAIRVYGEGVSIQNIDWSSEWNPLSVLFYFDMFGMVQNYEATAEVVR